MTSFGTTTIKSGASFTTAAGSQFNLRDGILHIAGGTTLNGPLAWTGGQIAGPGTTALNAATAAGGGAKTLAGAITNNGAFHWTGGSILAQSAGIGIANAAAIDLGADGTAFTNNELRLLTNAGTITKSAVAGKTVVRWAVSNTGAVRGNSGILRLTGPYSQTGAGGIIVDGGAVGFAQPPVI